VKRILSYLLFFTLLSKTIHASHIVGGEMVYDYLGGNNYRITLKLYRDCAAGNANFQGLDSSSYPAVISIIEGLSGAVDTVINIGLPVVTSVPASINNPCIQPPSGVCVERGIYTCTINLPPKQGGYYVVYQSCCRNATAINLVAGGTQGATYFAQIPGPEVAPVNNSPRFNNFPSIYICNHVMFTFDHSATDPDGDQLVYSLSTPFLGINQGCAIGAPGCPTAATAPPYQSVNYSGNYSGNYPIASNPSFTVNAASGLLTGKPTLQGQYVIGVCVKEYRNNILIGTHYRDFQFNVRACSISAVSLFADQDNPCSGSTITFTNQSFGTINPLNFHWDFGDGTTTADTSHASNPTYTYQDTGTYVVTLISGVGNPCADTSQKTVYVYPPLKVSFNTINKQCLKANSFSFNNTGTYINAATFNWNFGAAATPGTSTLKNPTGIVYSQTGLYFVKLVAKQLTCRDSMIDSVRILGRPQAKINNLPMGLCNPGTVAFSNGSSGELPMSYQWIFSNGNTSSTFEPVQIFSPAGVYGATLMVTTGAPCIDTSMASVSNITVFPAPVAGFSLSPSVTSIFDPQITFTNSSSGNATSWNYYFGDGGSSTDTNCVYVYSTPGVYDVMQVVANSNGCSDTVIKEVKILPEFRFWIPNTFTPNKDGMNDVFMPKVIGVSKYEFYIYNKWGEKIYSDTDPSQGWDGTFKGKKCEQDVYVWKIWFVNDLTREREAHFGQVLLLRADD
jgi:gliding motility-associated-like protein